MTGAASPSTSGRQVLAEGERAYLVLLVVTLAFAGGLKVYDGIAELTGGATHAWIAPMQRASVILPLGLAELSVAVLLVGPLRPVAATAAFAMAVLMAIAFSGILWSGRPTGTCGCFGRWEAPVGTHLGILAVLLISARAVWLATHRALRAPAPTRGG